MSADRRARIGAVVGGVLAQALRDSGAVAIIILDAATPEGTFLNDVCAAHDVPVRAVPRVPPDLAEALGGDDAADRAAARAVADAEAERHGALCAHPANRTVLLLARPPAAPLLPLGDVPGSTIAELCGDWSAPDGVRRLAKAAGGVGLLDDCLHRWLDRREPFAVAAAALPGDVARELRERLARGRFFRRRAGLVPKLGQRTIGHDLQI